MQNTIESDMQERMENLGRKILITARNDYI